MQRIKIASVEYRVKYDHIHYDPNQVDKPDTDPMVRGRLHEEIVKAFQRAEELGQVSVYGNQGLPPSLGPFSLPNMCGVTRCTLFNLSLVVAEGYSFCSALDNFNRKKGRLVSFGRAVKSLFGK